jgi:hypothetical protein
VRRPLVIAVVSLAALVGASQALALPVVRHDPDDFEIAPDVHTSVKRVFQNSLGKWRFRISASGDLGPDYRLKALIDVRGGPAAEFVMRAKVAGAAFVWCNVRRIGGARIHTDCAAGPFAARWNVALRALDAGKTPIRWRVVARKTARFGGTLTDRAPDAGWYP